MLGKMSGVRMLFKGDDMLGRIDNIFSIIVTGVGHGVLLRSVGLFHDIVGVNNALVLDNFCRRSIPMLLRGTSRLKLRRVAERMSGG